MSKRIACSLACWSLLLFGGLYLASPLAAAEATTSKSPCVTNACFSGKRPGDQVWVVCTRHLGCGPGSEALPSYRVQYFAHGAWHAANSEMFFDEDDAALPTVVFIHGNRFTSGDAIASGWEAYRALLRCSTGQPFRFVIWSWPSDKDGGPIRDARMKASRTLVEGYYVSRFITRIQPTVPTSLIGYSFGSRVALGAVHLAAGGQLAGRVVPNLPKDNLAMYRVAMLAAGVEDDGLLPGARFEMAMSRTDYLLNLYNTCDPALKRYRVVSKCEKPTAMGYTGIVGEMMLGDAALRISEYNVSNQVGKSHDESDYFASEYVMRKVRATVFGETLVVPATVAKK